MDSQFDPAVFLDATTTEANTRRPPLPPGLYPATIGEVQMKSGEKEAKDGTGMRPWVSAVVPLRIDVPAEVRQQFADYPPQVTLTDRAFLDLAEDGKSLDNGVGKNRAQRNYRDATGLNEPGSPFSWRMLQGRPVQVQVSHEQYNGETQERVAGVFKMK